VKELAGEEEGSSELGDGTLKLRWNHGVASQIGDHCYGVIGRD